MRMAIIGAVVGMVAAMGCAGTQATTTGGAKGSASGSNSSGSNSTGGSNGANGSNGNSGSNASMVTSATSGTVGSTGISGSGAMCSVCQSGSNCQSGFCVGETAASFCSGPVCTSNQQCPSGASCFDVGEPQKVCYPADMTCVPQSSTGVQLTTTGTAVANTGTSGTMGTGSTNGTTGFGTFGGSSGTSGACDCQALGCSAVGEMCDTASCACVPITTGAASSTTGTSGATGTTSSSLCSSQACVVYASSNTDLYQVDPSNPQNLTHLCTFNLNGAALTTAVTDIATQNQGALYGVTEQAVYTIDTTTCAMTQLATLSSGTGTSATKWVCLTFLVNGTLLAADETGDVATIDPSTGAVATVGNFGGTYSCSGDFVGINDANQTIFASAVDSSCKYSKTNPCNDLLVTLDPTNGYKATVVTTTSYYAIYGLGYWGGLLYGFSHSGQIFQMNTDGTGEMLLDVADGGKGGVAFSGAATTPLAPTKCPVTGC